MANYYMNSDGTISTTKKKKKGNEYVMDNNGNIVLKQDISPVKTTTSKKSSTNKEEENKDVWFKKGAFKDGYQFGDVNKTIASTTADVGVGITKGIFNLAEGIVDLGRYGISAAAGALGADKYAEAVKERAKENTTNFLFKGIESAVDKNSILGNKADAIPQGLGYVGGMIATGGLAGAAGLGAAGATAATTATTFSSAFGNGMSQAYEAGATDEEATKYGLIAGVAEAGTELMFGGLGKAVGATGLSKGFMALDDKLATKVSGMFKSTLAKNLSEYTIKAAGEGIEEVASGLIQAIGQKMTYMSDEDLGKLVEDQNLLESFITGAVVSGIAQTPSLVRSNTAGRDFVTNYTQNEQQVIDNEVETRIAEAEKDGTKLNNKQKTKIEEQVKSDLEKGYISTDAIEKTLGGEEYNNYKSTLDNKTSIENEIAELENKPYAEMTVKENERLQALREELKGIDTNTQKSNLDSSMSTKIAKDSLLQRSYQEKANRSVNYEADLNKYDAKQQETIQKAIDSGILNNTNKTHEFVDMVAKLSADKGVSFDFTNNTKLKDSGFAIDGKQVNGFVNKDGITLNIDSNNALNSVVGHEITHVLEGTDLYTELQSAIKEYATTKGVYDSKLAELQELYKDIEGANVENELTSDLVGEYLFTDTDFVNNLSTTKPNVFQKIYNEIKYMLKVATAGSKEARQLEKVKKTFDEAYKQMSNTTTQQNETNLATEADSNTTDDVKYSIVGIKNIKEALNNKNVDENTKKSLNKVLDNYNEALTRDGKESNEEIRQATGWFKDRNGDWKFEITDKYSKLKFIPEANKTYKLGDILDHKLLYDVNPEIKDLKVKFKDLNGTKGQYVNIPVFDSIRINNSLIEKGEKEIRSTLLHEIQHYNQRFNKFEQGLNSGKTLDDMIKYVNGLGEIEAKNVQERMDYSKDELKAIAPESSKENPIHPQAEQLIEKRKRKIANKSKKEYNNSRGVNNEEIVEEDSGQDRGLPIRTLGNRWGSRSLEGTSDSSFFNEKNTRYSLNNDDTSYQGKQFDKANGRGITADQFLNKQENKIADNSKDNIAALEQLEKVRNNPDADITIYRATPSDSINTGDWVFLNKEQAERWTKTHFGTPKPGYKVVEEIVKAKDVDWTGKNLEFVYNPQNDTKYSISDNQGRQLTEYTLEKTKNSKVRDENGNLMLMYHGSPDGTYNQLRAGTYFTSDKEYANGYQWEGASSISYGKKVNNPRTYEAYLNITNPFTLKNETAKKIYLNEYIKGGNSAYFDPYTDYTDTINSMDEIDWVEGVDLQEWLQENHPEYDGMYLDEGGAGGYGGADYKWRGYSVIPFSEEQIIKANNNNTEYSLSNENEIAPRQNNLTYGEDVRLQEQIAPLQQEISNLTETVNNLVEQIASVKTTTDEYTPTTYDDLASIEEQYANDFNNIDESNIPEGEGTYNELENENFNFLNNDAKELLKELTFGNARKINKLYKEIAQADNIAETEKILSDYKNIYEEDTNKKEIKKAIRATRLDISGIRKQLGNEFVRNNFGNLRLANDGLSVDSFYQELSSMYPEYFDSDVTAEADQLEALSYFMKSDNQTIAMTISDSDMNKYAGDIFNTVRLNEFNKQFKNVPIDERNIPSALNTQRNSEIAPVRRTTDWDSIEDTSTGKQIKFNDETQTFEEEDLVKKTKKELRKALLGTEEQKAFIESALDNAKNRSMALMNNTDTIRNTELVFGRDAGNIINEIIFQKEIDNEARSVQWQNEERKSIKDLGIKARSKESAAVQKYGEKQYVNEHGEVVPYGDVELAREFNDTATQDKIKNAAKELRNKYDEYIDLANGVLTKLGFDPIPKRNDYMRHFQELNDVFSRYGIPFNAQSMEEHVLPTDINGLTEYWSPQKNYFANMQARKGVKTTYDAITGIDGYISGISNLIYHTEDIQRGRAFEEMIRETYGEDKGWDNLENLPDELKQARADKIQDNHLSNYAAWVHEWTNNIAGKKNKIDRSIESMFGRKAFSFLDNARKQVGSNMIGFNLSSSLTNMISTVQAASKTNKLAFAKGTADTIKNIFIKDNFSDTNKFLINRMGTDMISKTPWAKIQDAGFIFMKGMDWFSSNMIVRSKYYENLSKGMDTQTASDEAGKFAARILGDRTKGANAQLYNSKLLGLVTQFQLEVNNQLYSQFYDTYHESKEAANGSALKTAAGMTFTLGQLFVLTHLFGQAFEAIAGYNPTFDVVEMIKTAFGWGDDDDEEKTTSERLKESADMLVDALPYVNILTGGGRIPVASGIPNLVGVATGGKDQYGNELTLEDEMKKLLYLVPPTGGNQVKKTVQGLSMYDDDFPIAGSYNAKGDLKYTADTSTLGKIQAGLFGKWASGDAKNYINSGFKSISSSKVDEMIELGMTSTEYRKVQSGMAKAGKNQTDKSEYILSRDDLTDNQKNILLNNIASSDKENEALSNLSLEDKKYYYDAKNEINEIKEDETLESNTKKYDIISTIIDSNLSNEGKAYLYSKYYESDEKIANIVNSGASMNDYLKYRRSTDGMTSAGKEQYLLSSGLSNTAKQAIYEQDVLGDIEGTNYEVAKNFGIGINEWLKYDSQEFESDKKANGKSISGSRKAKVMSYIESLNLSVTQKALLTKLEYTSFDTYNNQILQYIDTMRLTEEEKTALYKKLGFSYSNGTVRW